jgi:hypothetical protein
MNLGGFACPVWWGRGWGSDWGDVGLWVCAWVGHLLALREQWRLHVMRLCARAQLGTHTRALKKREEMKNVWAKSRAKQ